jgi:hypothetical protein
MFLLYIFTPVDDFNHAVRFIAALTLEHYINGTGNFLTAFSDVIKCTLTSSKCF